jgi:hypothetical protein
MNRGTGLAGYAGSHPTEICTFRFLETLQISVPVDTQDDTCRRCGAVSAKPHDDGSSLRERTAQVLDTRARRRAARTQRGRHTADE